jgi:hypothetical protein
MKSFRETICFKSEVHFFGHVLSFFLRSLMMETEQASETLDLCYDLTVLMAREGLTTFDYRQSCKSYISVAF